MNDRELLEKAAKAAGLKYTKPTADYSGALGLVLEDAVGRPVADWRPLTDDGDALRLAVKLRLDICRPFAEHDGVCVWVDNFGDFIEQRVGDDPYAATRRAITRAAAAMADVMEQEG